MQEVENSLFIDGQRTQETNWEENRTNNQNKKYFLGF